MRRKWPIGASGTTGTVVFSAPVSTEVDSARGDQVDLAVEDEGEARQAAGAGDRVDRARERLVEQRRRRRRVADRLPAGALCRGQLFLGADVAEVALVDREGLREGHRERFDVGVAGAGPEVESRLGFLLRAGGLALPICVIVIFGLKGRVAQLTAWK